MALSKFSSHCHWTFSRLIPCYLGLFEFSPRCPWTLSRLSPREWSSALRRCRCRYSSDALFYPQRLFCSARLQLLLLHPLWKRKGGKEMGFIMEFAENLILRLMEDPKERDRKFREHVYAVKDRCNKTKEMWSYPLRPYGFWTFERHNAQVFSDPQISQAPGRRDPYDDLLQEGFETPK